jgi:hypothetical protein
MAQAYSNPSRANDTYSLPDVEVFYAAAGELWQAGDNIEGWEPEEDNEPGFYYWFCFPGCMPDSDAHGPFKTEDEAIQDAQADAE